MNDEVVRILPAPETNDSYDELAVSGSERLEVFRLRYVTHTCAAGSSYLQLLCLQHAPLDAQRVVYRICVVHKPRGHSMAMLTYGGPTQVAGSSGEAPQKHHGSPMHAPCDSRGTQVSWKSHRIP